MSLSVIPLTILGQITGVTGSGETALYQVSFKSIDGTPLYGVTAVWTDEQAEIEALAAQKPYGVWINPIDGTFTVKFAGYTYVGSADLTDPDVLAGITPIEFTSAEVSERLLPTPIPEKLLVANNNKWQLSPPNINLNIRPNATIPEYVYNETWGFTVVRNNDRTVLLLNEICQDLNSTNLNKEWATMTAAMAASLMADTNWHVSYSTISDSSEHYNEFYGIYTTIASSPLYSYQNRLIQKINLNNHDFYSVYAISELQGIGLTEIYTGMRYDKPNIQLVAMARKIQSSL